MNITVANIRDKQIKSITPHALETIHPRYEHIPNFYQRIKLDPEDYRTTQNLDDPKWLEKLHVAQQKATLVAEFQQKCAAQALSGGNAWYSEGQSVDERENEKRTRKIERLNENEHKRRVAEVINEKQLLDAKRKKLAQDPQVREMKTILNVLEQRCAMQETIRQKALEKEKEKMVIALDRMQDAVDDLDWFQRTSDAECTRRLAGKERSEFYRQEIEDKRVNAAKERQDEVNEDAMQLERLRVQTLIDQQLEAERLRKKARNAANERYEFVAIRAEEKQKQRAAEEAEDERIRHHQSLLQDREAFHKARQRERAELTKQCYDNLKTIVDAKTARDDEFEQLREELVSHEKSMRERAQREAVRQNKINTRVELNGYVNDDTELKAKLKLEDRAREMQFVREMIAHNKLEDDRAEKLKATRLAVQVGSIEVQKRNEQLRQTLHDDEKRREKLLEEQLQSFRDTTEAEVAEERRRLLREAVVQYGASLVSCVRQHLQPTERDYLQELGQTQQQQSSRLCAAR